MKILKFGGTSVGSPEALTQVVSILKNQRSAPDRVQAVVVSAFGGVTNQLIEMARLSESGCKSWTTIFQKLEERHYAVIHRLLADEHQLKAHTLVSGLLAEVYQLVSGIFMLEECSVRTMDRVMSYGELLSAVIVTELFNAHAMPAHFLDTRQVIKTNREFGNARVIPQATSYHVHKWFTDHTTLAVATGFIASCDKGETTTLGRGGSDYTASILASSLNATEIEIYTDVNGMMTADPRVVPQAFTIGQISYAEAMELSHFGAKVIYPPTLLPAVEQKIPIRILNTFDPGNPGTIITTSGQGGHTVTGLSSIKEITLVNVQGSGLLGVAGFAGRLFTALARERINIILITQASSEHSISFAVLPEEADKSYHAIHQEFHSEFERGQIDPLDFQNDVSILAIVGEQMRQTPGVSGKLFTALGRNGVNVIATAQGSSELNISVVVRRTDLSKGLNALHQVFFTGDLKQLHLFLVGPGLIGKTLLSQITRQLHRLNQHHLINIRLCGLANSRQMILRKDGIAWDQWEDVLKKEGKEVHLAQWSREIKELNLPNSVVVDCTSSSAFLPFYPKLLARSIALVTPNKLANSGQFSRYRELQLAALHGNTRFCYETNVGAGLPVIETLRNLIRSGDRIHRIEAILSGTLSYIFNTFQPEVPFWKVVKQAKELGYTEPDPRDDLSGRDIARKILILARETGLELEPEDVVAETMLPSSCMEAPTVDHFFVALKEENAYFEQLVNQAHESGKKIKFISRLQEGKISLRLEQIGPEHPFWNTSGADNILAFYTDRYSDRPMVIQGPGAGAEVTAAGVFGEIIGLATA